MITGRQYVAPLTPRRAMRLSHATARVTIVVFCALFSGWLLMAVHTDNAFAAAPFVQARPHFAVQSRPFKPRRTHSRSREIVYAETFFHISETVSVDDYHNEAHIEELPAEPKAPPPQALQPCIVANPDEPAVKLQESSAGNPQPPKPEEPVHPQELVRPEEPVPKPEEPAKPVEPAVVNPGPEAKHEEPPKPEEPVAKHEEPPRPEEPVMKPEEPVLRGPVEPMKHEEPSKPEEPVVRSEEPVMKPEEAVVRHEEPSKP
ncbi:hypothetical protein DIPPA_65881, partial [Diplonema papillatum]